MYFFLAIYTGRNSSTRPLNGYSNYRGSFDRRYNAAAFDDRCRTAVPAFPPPHVSPSPPVSRPQVAPPSAHLDPLRRRSVPASAGIAGAAPGSRRGRRRKEDRRSSYYNSDDDDEDWCPPSNASAGCFRRHSDQLQHPPVPVASGAAGPLPFGGSNMAADCSMSPAYPPTTMTSSQHQQPATAAVRPSKHRGRRRRSATRRDDVDCRRDEVLPIAGQSTTTTAAAAPVVPTATDFETLVELQRRLAATTDSVVLKRVVEIIEQSGCYQLEKGTFDFDLCRLDTETVRKLRRCLHV